jgi:hypothetical protein
MGLMVAQMTATRDKMARMRSRRHSGQFCCSSEDDRFYQSVGNIPVDHKGHRWVGE